LGPAISSAVAVRIILLGLGRRAMRTAKEYMPVGEVSKILQTSEWTVRRLISNGRLQAHRFCTGKTGRGHLRISRESVMRYTKAIGMGEGATRCAGAAGGAVGLTIDDSLGRVLVRAGCIVVSSWYDLARLELESRPAAVLIDTAAGVQETERFAVRVRDQADWPTLIGVVHGGEPQSLAAALDATLVYLPDVPHVFDAIERCRWRR
jgi:excisionase family DNA binding protein